MGKTVSRQGFSKALKSAEQKNVSAEPKVEETTVEEPKIEEFKVEETKIEETKVEELKVEEPKVEEPKAEEPKVEEIKVEESKAETEKEEKKSKKTEKAERKPNNSVRKASGVRPNAIKYPNGYVQLSATISADLLEDINLAKTLYNSNFSDYITSLIKKDIAEHKKEYDMLRKLQSGMNLYES